MTETAKKKCPACAEEILAEALKCKHCGEHLGASSPSPSVASTSSSPVTTPAQQSKFKKVGMVGAGVAVVVAAVGFLYLRSSGYRDEAKDGLMSLYIHDKFGEGGGRIEACSDGSRVKVEAPLRAGCRFAYRSTRVPHFAAFAIGQTSATKGLTFGIIGWDEPGVATRGQVFETSSLESLCSGVFAKREADRQSFMTKFDCKDDNKVCVNNVALRYLGELYATCHVLVRTNL